MNDKSPMLKSDKSASTSVTIPKPTIQSSEQKSDSRTNQNAQSKEYADYNINPTR